MWLSVKDKLPRYFNDVMVKRFKEAEPRKGYLTCSFVCASWVFEDNSSFEVEDGDLWQEIQ